MIHDVRAQPTLMNSSYGNCKFEALEGCKCVNGTFDVVMETRGNICILSERVTEVLVHFRSGKVSIYRERRKRVFHGSH